ncbi:probable ABC transporter permease protein [Brevibacillus brevis NBRC 100599]|uniref:Probable ABC transporter permease protein n=1 Tax=Brevibacillus brevis (strain 47 / JCM 6285 / NBRC 100599) TaxID=358681 RepID=C0Z6M4_BREBN|nr:MULTISPECIES: iron ABC transporter permease [Bacillales]TQR32129.1 iron ABC transporter permease [Lysinibacillus sp. SDF0063]BAH46223.1 probable ABC transporter permease protein [Brevibacillus brevis NBRC 100599]
MHRHVVIRSKKPALSFHVDKRALGINFILFLLLSVVIVLSIGLGSLHIPVWEVVKAFVGAGSEQNELIVLDWRLPRVVVSVMVGASLAVSGAILQSLVRNPLASPDLIGTTAGATAAAVAFITFAKDVSVQWMPLVALIGGLLTATLTYLTAWKEGVSPFRLALVGVCISAGMGALTIFFLVITQTHKASNALGWMTGTVYGMSWVNVMTLLPWTVLFLGATIFQIRYLNAQELGDDIAKGIGVAIDKKRLLLIAISVALAGAAVGVAGGISFIGLMAPHIARRLVGSAYGYLLPASAVLGGMLVVLADLIGRTVFLPHDLPAGIFTAAIGAPFFVYLLYKTRNYQ